MKIIKKILFFQHYKAAYEQALFEHCLQKFSSLRQGSNGEQYHHKHDHNHKQEIHQDNIELQQEEELLRSTGEFENGQELVSNELHKVIFQINIGKFYRKMECLLLSYCNKRK